MSLIIIIKYYLTKLNILNSNIYGHFEEMFFSNNMRKERKQQELKPIWSFIKIEYLTSKLKIITHKSLQCIILKCNNKVYKQLRYEFYFSIISNAAAKV